MGAAVNIKKMGKFTRELVAFGKQCPTGTIRTDADATNFARMVEYQYAETYDIEYPELDMANGDILPIDRSVPAGAKTFVYYTYGGTGLAAVLNTYAANSIPTVGRQAKATTGTLHDMALAYVVNISDLEAAAMTGDRLQEGLGDATKRGHMLMRDQIGWFGYPSLGLYGLLTHPNTTQLVATAAWSSATYDQVLADVGSLINTPNNLSNGIEVVNTLAFPLAVANNLGARNINTANPNGDSFWTALQKAFPRVRFITSIMLDAANHAGTDYATKNVVVAFNNAPRKASLIIPKDFTILPPQWAALEMRVFTHSKIGGVKIPYPLSIAIMRGM